MCLRSLAIAVFVAQLVAGAASASGAGNVSSLNAGSPLGKGQGDKGARPIAKAKSQTILAQTKQKQRRRAALPDLAVRRLWLDNQCNVNVQITNSGKQKIANRALRKSTLSLRYGKRRVPISLSKVDPRGRLSQPGGTVSFRSTVRLKKRTVVSAAVDSRNTIRELNERNNAIRFRLQKPCLTLTERKARKTRKQAQSQKPVRTPDSKRPMRVQRDPAKPDRRPIADIGSKHQAKARDRKVAGILKTIERARSLDDLRKQYGRNLRLTEVQQKLFLKALKTTPYKNKMLVLRRNDPVKKRASKNIVLTKARHERRVRQRKLKRDANRKRKLAARSRRTGEKKRTFKRRVRENLQAARAQNLRLAQRWGAPVRHMDRSQMPDLDYSLEITTNQPVAIGQEIVLRSGGRGFGLSVGRVGLLYFETSEGRLSSNGSELRAALDLTAHVRSWTNSHIHVRIPEAVAETLADHWNRQHRPEQGRIWVQRADITTERAGAFAAIAIEPDPFLLEPEVTSISTTELSYDNRCLDIRGRNFLSTHIDSPVQEESMGEFPSDPPPDRGFINGSVLFEAQHLGAHSTGRIVSWSDELIVACIPPVYGVKAVQLYVTVRTRTNKYVTHSPELVTYTNNDIRPRILRLDEVVVACEPWILGPFGVDTDLGRLGTVGPVQWALCWFGEKKKLTYNITLHNGWRIIGGEIVLDDSNGFYETPSCGAYYVGNNRPREGAERAQLEVEYWVNPGYICKFRHRVEIQGQNGVPHTDTYNPRETIIMSEGG